MKIVFIGENPTVRRLVELSAAKAGMMVEMAEWNDCDLSTANFVVVEYEALGEDGTSILSFVPAGIKRIAVMPRDQEVPDVFDVSIRKPFLPTELVDLFLSNAPIESAGNETQDENYHESLNDDDLDINLDELDDMVHGLHDEMIANSDSANDENLENSMSGELNLDFEELTDGADIDFGDTASLDEDTSSVVLADEVVSNSEDESHDSTIDETITVDDEIDFGDELSLDEDILTDNVLSEEIDSSLDDKIDFSDELTLDDMNEHENVLDDVKFDEEESDLAKITTPDVEISDTLCDDVEDENGDLIFDEPFTDEMDQLLDEVEVAKVDDQKETVTEDFDSYLDDAVDEKSDDKKDDSILDMNDIAQLKDLLADDDDFDSLDEKDMRVALGEDIEEMDEINEDALNGECEENEVEICNKSLSEVNEMTTPVTSASPADLLTLLSTLSSQKLREVLDGATITVSITYPKNGDNE